MPLADHAQAIEYAFTQIRQRLAPEYVYHNLWHTQQEVTAAVQRLARLCRIPADDEQLLLIAAAYHDIGFLETHHNHELASLRIVAQTLPAYGFQASQIERIMGMILATRLPQSPRNQLEAILADADLDVLGRDDFFVRNEALRQENTALGRPFSRREWLESQLAFMQKHRYFTLAARRLRRASKLEHIATLTIELAQLDDNA